MNLSPPLFPCGPCRVGSYPFLVPQVQFAFLSPWFDFNYAVTPLPPSNSMESPSFPLPSRWGRRFCESCSALFAFSWVLSGVFPFSARVTCSPLWSSPLFSSIGSSKCFSPALSTSFFYPCSDRLGSAPMGPKVPPALSPPVTIQPFSPFGSGVSLRDDVVGS